MRRRVSKRELLRRLEALKHRLSVPTEPALPGQETIPLATIEHRDEDDLEETR